MTRSALWRCGRIAVTTALVAFASSLVAAASASAFAVQGSVEQVDVTGLASGAQASLLSKSGATVLTQEADAQGGLLFRNVNPGKKYRAGVGGLDGQNV